MLFLIQNSILWVLESQNQPFIPSEAGDLQNQQV